MAEKVSILVTGANGQLGQSFKKIASRYSDFHFVFADRSLLDVTEEEKVKAFFSQHSFQYCINCAAYTAVDKAEEDKENALKGNVLAPRYLAQSCKQARTTLVHFSTDYVFNGEGQSPYLPDDPVQPVNYYGSTKLDGEKAIQQECEDYIIIRTSWVYSEFGKNFVKTMLNLMESRDAISVVNDQKGAPTYAVDLADAVMQMFTKGLKHKGIYHYSNKGMITWFEFAVSIQQLSGLNCQVNPIPTSGFPTPAKRPAFSVLDTSTLEKDYQIQIPEWKESLKTCIQILRSS